MPKRALTAFLFVQAHSCSARRWNAEGSSRDAPRRSNRTAFGCRMARVAALVGLLLATERWVHWGATREERSRPLAGDTLLPAAQSVSTQAITIAAPTDKVRPWLAQMGYGGRAGFYSYALVEHLGGARETQRPHGLPSPRPGERIPYFTRQSLVVAVAEPPRVLVLIQRTPAPRRTVIDWTWSFVLCEARDATRLIVRMRTHYAPERLSPLVGLLLTPAHAVMGRRQLLGIAQRVIVEPPSARSLMPASPPTGGTG